MSRFSVYVNEFIGFIVMLLLLAALVSGQLNSPAVSLVAADDDRAKISRIRLEDE